MTHAQLNATGRRRDSATSWRVGKLFDAPLFAVSRSELLKAVRDAVRALALDRSERQLVECLAVCFGEQQLAHGLLCWPSNTQIEKKTGMSERTIRRTIVKLRERGLILMRDSANGKRFPISNAEGEVVDARGFDLTPLHARAAEFAERARALDIED
jgi:replication initiation protein RepC